MRYSKMCFVGRQCRVEEWSMFVIVYNLAKFTRNGGGGGCWATYLVGNLLVYTWNIDVFLNKLISPISAFFYALIPKILLTMILEV